MAVHRDFEKLMADIEIYVDGIAAMQIQSLNSVVDLARVEIIGQYRPGESDRIIKTLETAHINEDRYFSDMVDGDIDRIIRDIREAHKGDSTSAPELSVAAHTVSRLSSRPLYVKTGSAVFFLPVGSCGGSAPTPPALSKEQNTISSLDCGFVPTWLEV